MALPILRTIQVTQGQASSDEMATILRLSDSRGENSKTSGKGMEKRVVTNIFDPDCPNPYDPDWYDEDPY